MDTVISNLRIHKLAGIALFDLILSMSMMIITFLVAWKIKYRDGNIYGSLKFVVAAILLTIPFGIIAHVLFGVDTRLNYILGLSDKP